MAQITVYHDSGVEVDVLPGNPPQDQSALVAQLQGEVDSLTQQVATLTSEKATLEAEKDTLVAEKAALQGKVDQVKAAVAVLVGL